jgi:hypothetical protein
MATSAVHSRKTNSSHEAWTIWNKWNLYILVLNITSPPTGPMLLDAVSRLCPLAYNLGIGSCDHRPVIVFGPDSFVCIFITYKQGYLSSRLNYSNMPGGGLCSPTV